MRVLVTGGHGFVGSHLVDRLLGAGDEVRVLYRREGLPASLAGRKVEVARGDARDPLAVRRAVDGVDEVHHLAALTRSRTRGEMLRTNVGATRVLADALIGAGSRARLVFCSSVAAVGPSPDGHDLDEDAPPRPVTWYGESKRMAEALVRERAGVLAGVILRPPAVYGPRDRDLLAVFRAASRGLLPILGEGEHVYNFVYAADLADAFVVAARHPATEGRTFFVHHPARVEMRAFLRQVAAAVERRARWLAIPDSALRVAAAVSEILGQVTPRPPLLGRQRLLELAGAAYVTSPAAFERETGWRAAVDLAEGTRRTARWYREHGWLPRRGGPRVDDSRPQVENPPEGGT